MISWLGTRSRYHCCAITAIRRTPSNIAKCSPMQTQVPAPKGRKANFGVGSERELARIHSVSLMTARHVLSELAKAGVANRRPEKGIFVVTRKSSADCGVDPLSDSKMVYRSGLSADQSLVMCRRR